MTAAPRTDVLAGFAFPDLLPLAEGLVARAVISGDIPTLGRAFRDPDVGGEASIPPLSDGELEAAIRERLPEWRARGLLMPYVIEEQATDALLGGLNLHHLDPMRSSLEVGYWLFPDARGHGVATTAVRAATVYAFENGIRRVEAHVRVGNAPSERVLERSGFVREGVKRRYLPHGDDLVDATIFSRLADD